MKPIIVTGRVIQVNETVKKLNPAIFTESAAVGGLAAAERKQCPQPALDGDPKTFPRRKGRLAVVVTIIACRRRVLDSDNHVAGCKPLRDIISRSLATDDGSECISFEYGQLHTTGPEGTIVRIAWV